MSLKQMGVSIDKQIQIDFKKAVEKKHQRVRGVYGSEVENAMKVYLTLQGSELYQDDPDVISMLGAKSDHTHTLSTEDRVVDVINERINEIVEDKFDTLKEKLDDIERKVKGKSAKKTGSLAQFKKQFKAEYGECKQVSRRDIVRFVTDNDGVCDPRSIQSRIEYLLAHDVLEPFAQNVYNLKF
jgi:hypothetical protein